MSCIKNQKCLLLMVKYQGVITVLNISRGGVYSMTKHKHSRSCVLILFYCRVTFTNPPAALFHLLSPLVSFTHTQTHYSLHWCSAAIWQTKKVQTCPVLRPLDTHHFEECLWSDVWLGMVTHTWYLCSAFHQYKCTHTVVHTHTWFKSCSLQSWYWRLKRALVVHYPTYNPRWTRDLNPQPSGYKSNSLSIRPWLPVVHN